MIGQNHWFTSKKNLVSGGFHLYKPCENKILISAYVVWDERRGWDWKTKFEDTNQAGIEPGTFTVLWDERQEDVGQIWNDEESLQEGGEDESDHSDVTPIPVRRSTRNKVLPKRLVDYQLNVNELMLTLDEEPKNYNEAKLKLQWLKAMKIELDYIVKNNTWKLVYLSKDVKPIGLKFKVIWDFNNACKKKVVYKNVHNGEFIIVAVYVDDLFMTRSSLDLINESKKRMASQFEMSNLGELTYYSGIEVSQEKDYLKIKQERYALKILKEVGMEDCNVTLCQMEKDLKLSKTKVPPMPEFVKDETLEQTRKQCKWENDDHIYHGHILNGMSNALFDVYQNMGSEKELWDQLESKYMEKDASSKKFFVSNFNNYKMVDSSIIDKLPPLWKDFKHSLKHNKDDLSLVQLGSHFRIEKTQRVEESGKENAGSSLVNMKKDSKNKNNNKNNKAKKRKNDGNNDGSNKKFKLTCWKCGRTGHFKKDCFVKKTMVVTLLVWDKDLRILIHHKDDVFAWWIESGATCHACKDRCWFDTLHPVQDGSILHIGDDSKDVDSSMSHARLGKFHYQRMLAMFKDNLIPEFDITLEKCNTCMVTKITRQPFKDIKLDSNVLELIHSDLCDFHATSSLRNQNKEEDPRMFDEAMHSRDVPFWKEAINDEMDSIMKNNTWILSDLPPGSKPLGCKWIFKMKMKVNGTIDKFKARLDMGEADVILSIRTKHEDKGITITQSYYIEKILKKFKCDDCCPVSTPLELTIKLMPNTDRVVDQLEYPRAIALAVAGKEAEWLRNLIYEILLWPKPISPIFIHCDSATTLAKAYCQIYNGKSRHLDHLTKQLARDLVHKSAIRMGLKSIEISNDETPNSLLANAVSCIQCGKLIFIDWSTFNSIILRCKNKRTTYVSMKFYCFKKL
ncbi:zinc finger, CCHC-type containing protein [Tanacetum coccineum]